MKAGTQVLAIRFVPASSLPPLTEYLSRCLLRHSRLLQNELQQPRVDSRQRYSLSEATTERVFVRIQHALVEEIEE